MLVDISIRDVVLIERLDLPFSSGLGVLTGETGAGKSILLDALGLALGMRGDATLVRHGADRATVSATFVHAPNHPVATVLAELDLPADDVLVLRRILGSDGRGRAYVNDQPVSVALLRRIGELLVEIQGQFAQRGLLNPATHRAALDAFAAIGEEKDRVAAKYQAWRDAEATLGETKAAREQARAEEEFLRHGLGELDTLEPSAGEEAELDARRGVLRHREKLVEALRATFDAVSGSSGADPRLRRAARELEGVADKAPGRIEPILAHLDRALGEVAEAEAAIEALGSELGDDSATLEEVEDRLFALRDLARKHRRTVDELPALRTEFAQKLELLDEQDGLHEQHKEDARTKRRGYEAAAAALSEARIAAASRLDRAVAVELPPLKLEKSTFRTEIDRLEETQWGPEGWDRVGFVVSTNPGTPPGPIARIASGGELSRFMLALKVCLSSTSHAPHAHLRRGGQRHRRRRRGCRRGPSRPAR